MSPEMRQAKLAKLCEIEVRRDKQGERPYCLTGECYPASNRCLIEMLPLPHVPGTEIPKTLFKSLLLL